jgi:hypothetical protein
MDINGLEGKSRSQLQAELRRGGKFVVYLWVVSILIYTWKRPSSIYYIPPGGDRITPGLLFSVVSFFLGWWGIPWGIFYTAESLYKNFTGGEDVTLQMKIALDLE